MDIKSKCIKWMWLPLSLSIFSIELIQRGLAIFAKAKDLGIPHLQQAMSVYFIVLSAIILICGYLCDNFSSRKILLYATIAGALGILTLPYTPLGFGLVFGAAAAFIKISPFSAPLKLVDGGDALRIAPQAAAKNIGGALFILLLGTLFSYIGWTVVVIVLAALFLLIGLLAYRLVPDDKVEGWKWSVFKDLAKQPKFWLIMVYFFFMSGLFYLGIKGFVPALVGLGLTTAGAGAVMAISLLIAGALRFFFGWLDKKISNVKLPLMIIGTLGMAACIPITATFPIFSLVLFTIMSAIHTPYYWAWCKEQWGKTYISTTASLGFVAMYLGAGVLYGAW